MSMSVIAEGVESAAQLGRLRTLGCDYVQGFFISQPLHSADFEDFLFRFDRGATRHPTTRRIPCIIDEDGPTRPALALAAFDEVFDVTERRGGESGTARH
jgi:hypothetical protein